MKKAMASMLVLVLVLSMIPAAIADEQPIKLYFVSRSLGLSGDEDTVILDIIEDKFNVDITWEVIPSNDYQTVTRNMIASGEYPDMMEYHNSNTEVTQGFIEDGILLPLNDLLEKYGQNLLRVRNEEGYWWPDENGERWIIPCRYNSPETFITIRQDWLDNLNLEKPTTLEELVDVLYAFTFNDPDGNGKDDTYGLGGPLDGKYSDIMMPIMASFGITMNWDVANAEIGGEKFVYIPWQLSDNMKECVRFFRDNIYTKGLCDPDFMVMSRQDYLNKKNANTYGVEYWYLTHTNSGWYNTFMESVPHAKLAALSPVKYQDYTTVWPRTIGAPNHGGFNLFLFKDCEHPELVIQILDFMASDEGYELIVKGIENENFVRNDDGTLTNLEISDARAAEIGAGKYSSVFWVQTDRWNYSELYTTGLESIAPYLRYGRIENYVYDGDTSALNSIINSSIITMMTDPSVDIDVMWEEMRQEYYDMGGRDLMRFYNENLLRDYGEDSIIYGENHQYVK